MTQAGQQSKSAPLRLHIGGHEKREGWTIMDTLPGPQVDILGNCRDLSQFADGSVAEIYASHVYEHLSYMNELVPALEEAFRVLKSGGLLRLGVPDLEVLCRLFLKPGQTPENRGHLMRIMLGGQIDEFDYHKSAFWFDAVRDVLTQIGFKGVQRVASFGLFKDTTEQMFDGQRISLNVSAYKA
ncbi:MAG: methyltransferase domain-containing protein [Planctomycetes bacterium]|nr:methyltransferase domain-containing protein [Planctomycetota bacterium]